jgi:DNA-binding NarL/FixJ family response regulator
LVTVTSVLLAAATVRVRAMHRVALAADGFDVHQVERPDEVISRLTTVPMDAMVIDVTQAFGGSALLQQVASDAQLPPAVLALTPVNDPAVVQAALNAGATDYLPVTVSADRVVAAVRRLTQGPRGTLLNLLTIGETP